MIETAKAAALIGGKILTENFGKIMVHEIETKSINNFVTFVDRLSEEKIIEKIRESCPDHQIYAEESGRHDRNSEYKWIIDPLDGTANYVHGIPVFSISIALEKHGEIILGVVYDPVLDEMFYAEKGKGAYLNNQKLICAQKSSLGDSIISTGFPYKNYHDFDDYIKLFSQFIRNTAGLRRMGSAALDLAYTAAGRFDGFWELDLSPWDIAAGILIIEEAGGVVTDIHGNHGYMETGNVIASNKTVHEQMLKLLKSGL
jgi:myo-inositol-1(or 4)-monophosphatase